MNTNLNLKAFCTALLSVNPKIPIRLLNEKEFIFRGDRIRIKDNNADGSRIKFEFKDYKGFLNGLLDKGLMLGYYEKIRFTEKYETMVK